MSSHYIRALAGLHSPATLASGSSPSALILGGHNWKRVATISKAASAVKTYVPHNKILQYIKLNIVMFGIYYAEKLIM